ncbi:TonB-dependent receptor plug domain-containing protein [Pseudothauera lacus]|nr:TonB-dependent receptor [Pseudothauera lacus]
MPPPTPCRHIRPALPPAVAALVGITVAGPAPASDDLFFSELPIVASVSRLPQRLADAPSAVTVIDRATIRASGARALSDVFRLVPGFQTFAGSDKPVAVHYHGITDQDYAARTQVLIDGRSLHSPLFSSGMNWELVPVALEDIERIEVVRGSNTTAYGTNAFLGVINIVTREPALVRGLSLAASNGNQGVRDHTLRTGGALGEAGNFRLTLQERRDDGLDHRLDPHPVGANWRTSNRTRTLDVRSDFQLGQHDYLEFSFGRAESRQLTGRVIRASGAPEADNPLRNLDQASTWLQARWLHSYADFADFALRYTYSADTLDNSFVHPTLGKTNPYGGRGTRHEIEALHTFLPSANTRLAWGASWRRDTYDSSTMLYGMGKVTRNIGRVFANGDWRPTHWLTLNAGLSEEYDSIAGSHFAPRASINLHIDQENTLRLGYARAWRTPSTLDYKAYQRATPATMEWVGNPDLPAERLKSVEVGYLGDWRAWRMSLDVRHFREQVFDRQIMRIRPSAVPGYTVQNVHDLELRGYEFQWKWQPFDGTRLQFNHASIRIDAMLSPVGQWLAVAPGNNFSGRVAQYNELSENSAPRRSSSLLWMQALPGGFDFSVAYYRVREIKWTRNTDAEPYNRTDARVAYTFRNGARRGELAYTMQSIDGRHAEERMERIVERRHWVTLSLDL